MQNKKLKTKIKKPKYMDEIHHSLVRKVPWYAAWHSEPGMAKFHWAALVSITIVIGLFIVNAINPFIDLHGVRSRASAAAPELPRVYLDSRVSSTPVTGRTINVPAGGDFQAALNSAVLGDEIVLTAGATYTAPSGGYVLPNKSGSGWLTIRTSNMAGLPAEGTRVSPNNSSAMPKIITPATEPALTTAAGIAPISGSTTPAGPHNYRFIGIEFGMAPSTTINYGIIVLGRNRNQWDPAQNRYVPDQVALNQTPYNLIFDRVYIHGNATGNVARGIGLNSASTSIIDSYFSNIHNTDFDAQAIAGWNGPGPYKINNNYLEGSGENVLFGGADSASVSFIPSDIEFRHNYVAKPLSWKVGHPTYAGIHWAIKNLIEFKSAQRVLVDGNIFEHSWTDGQQGWCLVLTPRNQEGTAPWSVVQDVTFSNNICRDTENTLDTR
jgi:hypothetical protein